MTADRCGTKDGPNDHVRGGTPLCEECKQVRREYQRDLRAKNPQLRERGRVYGQARTRALTRLSRLYPAVYLDLFSEELVEAEARVASPEEGSES